MNTNTGTYTFTKPSIKSAAPLMLEALKTIDALSEDNRRLEQLVRELRAEIKILKQK